MDEPTSSPTVREEETLFGRTVDQLVPSGIGIVYISHRMADVLRLSDHISDRQRWTSHRALVAKTDVHRPYRVADVAIAGKSGQVTADREGPDQAGSATVRAGPPALLVSGLGTARKLSDIAFNIEAGEIVGLAGLVGSGRSTLAKAIFGLVPDATGAILVKLRAKPCKPPTSRVRSRPKSALSPRGPKTGRPRRQPVAGGEFCADKSHRLVSHARGFGLMATRGRLPCSSRAIAATSACFVAVRPKPRRSFRAVTSRRWSSQSGSRQIPTLLILDEPTSGVLTSTRSGTCVSSSSRWLRKAWSSADLIRAGRAHRAW